MRRREPTGRKRVALALVGAALVGSFLLPPLGSASKPKKVATTASKLIVDADSVSGSVQSHRSECKRGRKVVLRSTAAGKQGIGSAKTNAKGAWLITIQLGTGTYFADVPSATRHGKKNGDAVTFQCRAVKSAPVTL